MRVAQMPRVSRTLVLVAIACGVAAAVLSVYVAINPFIPEDAAIERDVQSTQWGPLALTFPVFSWIGDAKGAVLEAIIFAAILVFNRRAWVIAAGAALTGAWYALLAHLIVRPRPTTAQVLQVTEHPGASSYPSGHTMFIVTVTVVLMLCFGHRFLPRWALGIGWALTVLIVIATGISRIYTGAHWPTDVLAGLFIATAWLTLVLSLRWMSDRVFESPRPAERRRVGVAS